MKIGDRTYNILKNLAQIWLPAAGTLYFALAQIWTLPGAEKVTGTVIAVDTFLGALLAISTATYNASGRNFDGTLSIGENEQGSYLKLESVVPASLEKESVTFKVVQPPTS